MASLLFPHKELRDEQNKLLLLTDASIQNKRNLIVHAPTGLGKTAATLGPALAAAISKELTVLFLTSRHTQHKIAIDTLKQIKEKYNLNFGSVSIIGKKWMCLVPGIEALSSGDFSDYCKKMREDKKCEFYVNARKNPSQFTIKAESLLSSISMGYPLSTEEVIRQSSFDKMCPYEISIGMAKKAKVIITDYYYLFHPDIGDSFLLKLGKEIDKFIVIIDEAHNLPFRLKELASEQLTSITIQRAIKEARKLDFGSILKPLEKIERALDLLAKGMELGSERLVTMNEFQKILTSAGLDYDQVIDDLKYIGESVRETQKQSYVGVVSAFLKVWLGADEGFTRILSMKRGLRENYISLSYKCLDPSVICKETINSAHSTILMSGTLLPTSMYKELLGVDKCQEVVFRDPFPKGNRLNLIVPKTTTKFTSRSEDQFKDIAKTLAEMVNIIPGNIAVFFPSYYLRDKVKMSFDKLSEKTVFSENPELNKEQKQELLDAFKGYKDIGAVLLAAASGSFGEGIDLPGDLLKAVIVVGLPLNTPDLETKELINYFDKKFKKGWDYGYLFPAFNKTLQNAGRCIRSETDKGVIIFLDERYAWPNYKRCFPEDWDLVISTDYKEKINGFFGKK